MPEPPALAQASHGSQVPVSPSPTSPAASSAPRTPTSPPGPREEAPPSAAPEAAPERPVPEYLARAPWRLERARAGKEALPLPQTRRSAAASGPGEAGALPEQRKKAVKRLRSTESFELRQARKKFKLFVRRTQRLEDGRTLSEAARSTLAKRQVDDLFNCT